MPRSAGTRLTTSPEFERVYRRGESYRGRLISVHAFPGESGASRLGLSVSKKVGGSVVRNTVKRRLREIFWAAFPEMRCELDLVISAKPAAAVASYHELEAEFGRALRKLDSPAGSSRE